MGVMGMDIAGEWNARALNSAPFSLPGVSTRPRAGRKKERRRGRPSPRVARRLEEATCIRDLLVGPSRHRKDAVQCNFQDRGFGCVAWWRAPGESRSCSPRREHCPTVPALPQPLRDEGR